MGISLIGLIAFQWQWIDTAIKTNDDKFRQDVMESLSTVVQKIERQEAVRVINQQMLRSQSYNSYPQPSGSLNLFYEFTGNMDSIESIDFTLEVDSYGQVRYSAEANSSARKASAPLSPSESPLQLVKDTLQLLKKEQSNLEKNAQFQENAGKEEMMRQTLEKVNNKSQLLVTALEELMYNRPLDFRLPEGVLDSMLRQELKQRGVDIDFEYGIWQPRPLTWLAGNTEGRQKQIIESSFAVSLFPNDIYGVPRRLSVVFPNQDRFLSSKLWVNMLSSGVLLIIIVVSFGYSIYTIFRQKKLSEMKNDFINNMTHEFKTPIATIGLAVEALQDPALASVPLMHQRYLQMIGDENQRLGNQVEKVLQMAIVEREELKLELRESDMHEVIREAVSKISLQLESKGGELNLVLDAESANCQIDPTQMIHVLLNLLDNAIKYSEDAPKIIIRTLNSESKLTVSIKDHGIGMSKEAQQNIFQSFYRVSTGNLHDVKGFGLGLSFVKNILEEHQGTISVDSELGSGTKFTFTLPT
ncbi:MAG: two-component system phosphate regulon sensor histidine kinase PhoR [Cyclobacteriaceae bacterium]|jgi:two-component system phosphate regulon sensor histidine kinase PhoR